MADNQEHDDASQQHRSSQGAQPPKGYRPPAPPQGYKPPAPSPSPAVASTDPGGAMPQSGTYASSTAGHVPHTEGSAGPAAEYPQVAKAPEVTLPAFLKPVRLHHVLTLFIGHAAAYLVILFLALITVMGFLIGVAIDGDGTGAGDMAPLVDQLDLSGVILFFTLPFQIAGVWLLGTFGLSLSAQGQGIDLLALWAPNLLVLALAGFVAVTLGRFWARRKFVGHLKDLPWAAKAVVNISVALVAALLTLLLTVALAFRQTVEIPMMGELRVVGTAVSASLFFGAFFFYGIIGLLLSTPQSVMTRVRGKIDEILPSASRVPRVLATHALIIVVPALVYVTINVGIETGATGVLTFFFWAALAAIVSFMFLNSAALTASIGASGFGETHSDSETFYLWTSGFAWWEVLICVILGLAAIAAASLVWALRRDSREATLNNLLSWLALPLSYAVGGVLLTFFSQVRGSFDAGGFAGGDFVFGPAWWTFAILFVVGIVIEALSRFAAPHAVSRLPPRVISVIQK